MLSKLKQGANKVLQVYKYIFLLQLIHRFAKVLVPYFRAKFIWRHIPGKVDDFFFKKFQKNVKQIYHEQQRYMLANRKKGVDFVKGSFGPQPELICVSEAAVNFVFKDEVMKISLGNPNDNFQRKIATELMGDETLIPLDHTNPHWFKEWKGQRHIVKKLFTQRNFQTGFLEVVIDRAIASVALIKRMMKTEKFVDMQDVFSRFTMDCSARIVFGNKETMVEQGIPEGDEALDDAFKLTLRLFNDIASFVFVANFLPWPYDQMLVNFGRSLSQNDLEFKRNMALVNDYAAQRVQKLKLDPNLNKRSDAVSSMIKSGKMSDKQIKEGMILLTLGGRDTATCALSWIMYELGKQPHIQDQLYEEIHSKVDFSKPLSADILQPENLPLVNAVIREGFRMHPPFPELPRISTKPMYYHDGTYIPPNTLFKIPIYSLCRDPERYEDPNTFKPNRWIPFKPIDASATPIFGCGMRNCVGEDLAWLELRVLLVMLFKDLRFETKKDQQVFYSLNQTMSISDNEERSSFKFMQEPILREPVQQN